MISPRLLALVRCPACHGTLTGDPSSLTCASCGKQYGGPSKDFLDLRPHETFEERTKYLDEALHADARHERVSPPLLGSKIRNDMLRAFLAPGPDDLVVDLGCGSGRALLWNRDWRAQAVGIDISPFFAAESRTEVDLLLGDLRRLPFADGTFTKGYSLDVLEHLSPDALRGMLKEAARVIAPGGTLFVYTHVRKNAPIAAGLRWINALARRLERMGLIDMRQERLRKSDHLNPLADIPELRQVAADTGFRIKRIRYYTPLVGGFVENILMRLAEKRLADRAKGAEGAKGAGGAGAGAPGAGAGAMSDEDALKIARAQGKERVARSRSTRAVLRVLSAAMKLDLLLFGHVESGPFFALLERTADPRPPIPDPR
ncbi:MAG TPA: methyltransferase domain-containing protein [Vicinamibacterales bacterium]|nr:methyltransferase domain-containing protein [Vicinamibacterales bacterium]